MAHLKDPPPFLGGSETWGGGQGRRESRKGFSRTGGPPITKSFGESGRGEATHKIPCLRICTQECAHGCGFEKRNGKEKVAVGAERIRPLVNSMLKPGTTGPFLGSRGRSV